MAKKPAAAAPKNKWDDELEAIFAAHERIMAKRRAADVPKQFAKQTKWDDELDALNVAFERRYRAAVAEREKCDAAAAPRSEEPNRSLRRRSTKHPWNKICGEIAAYASILRRGASGCPRTRLSSLMPYFYFAKTL